MQWANPVPAQGIHNPMAQYFAFDDSPFASVSFSAGYFHLEKFENGFLSTAGVIASGGLVLLRSDAFSDSVDGDDGVVDNNGNTGGATTGAFYSAGFFSIEFAFDASKLGEHLPTHVGLVLTDCSADSFVTLRAFRGDIALGSISGTQISEKMHFTQQDRFYGFFDSRGIDRFVLSLASDNDWAMDHLQYGYAPCPGDLNGDGLVEDSDFSIFVGAYDTLDCTDPLMPPGCQSDLNRDGLVDDSDFSIFVVAYNALLCP